MKKLLFALVVLALLVTTQNANAKTYRTPAVHTLSISKSYHYGYTYHRLTRIRCAYSGCRSKSQP